MLGYWAVPLAAAAASSKPQHGPAKTHDKMLPKIVRPTNRSNLANMTKVTTDGKYIWARIAIEDLQTHDRILKEREKKTEE